MCEAAEVSRNVKVSWCKKLNRYEALVWHDGKYNWAGYYDSEKEAMNSIMYNTCKRVRIPRVKKGVIAINSACKARKIAPRAKKVVVGGVFDKALNTNVRLFDEKNKAPRFGIILLYCTLQR